MTNPCAPALTRTHCLSFWRMGLCLLSLHPLLLAASKNDWPVIPAEELACTASPLDPEAPAEILERLIDLDLRGAPVDTYETEYTRYKIYAPEKSDAYTRVSRIFASNTGSSYAYEDLDITARLTLPDGTVKLFTKKDLRDRPYKSSVNSSGALSRLFASEVSAREKFLAVTGVLPGSILEYRISRERGSTADLTIINSFNASRTFPLQNRDLPTRKASFVSKAPTDSRFSYQVFTINRSIGQSVQNSDRKKGIISITATNLPPSRTEPLSGPLASYSLNILECISDTNSQYRSRSNSTLSVSANTKTDGLWSPIAARAYWVFTDSSEVTASVKKLAAKLTASASDPLEKARAIHDYIQKSCQEYRRRPKPTSGATAKRIISIDNIIECINEPSSDYRVSPLDYLHLAHALYKSIGLETRGIRFPDRSNFPFGPQLVAETALPEWAVQVKIDGTWHNSMPHNFPIIPFPSLPWKCEGQLALVAKEGAQELIEIENSKSTFSKIFNSTTLSLQPDGTLEAQAKRKYSGHHATTLRASLSKSKNPNAIKGVIRRLILSDLADAGASSSASDNTDTPDDSTPPNTAPSDQTSVTITDINGLDDTSAPIEINYTFRIPSYALVTPERIILRPSVYRSKDKHPFSSETRQNAVRFPFAWQEIDSVTLALPEGFALETPNLPSAQAGPILHHRHKITTDLAAKTLNYRREFVCNVNFFPANQYPTLKAWFDNVEHADHHEIILSKAAAQNPAPPAPAAVESTPATPAANPT